MIDAPKSPRRTRFALMLMGQALVSASLACTEPAGIEIGSDCIEALDLDCDPAFEPTYDAVFENVLRRTCGSASTGGVCHFAGSEGGGQGGLALSDRETAYDELLGSNNEAARVLPDAPECSALVKRLESSDPNVRMPVGRDPLPIGERCAVRLWIANGAKR